MLAPETQRAADIINSILTLVWAQVLKCHDYSSLTAIFECMTEIWGRLFKHLPDSVWLYKHHGTDTESSSVLSLLVGSLRIINKNMRIHSVAIRSLCTLLEKCNSVNELLLFVTECINLRLTNKLDQLTEEI